MPFFSVGYQDKERVEVTLLGPPADPKSEGYDWVKALVQVEVGTFKGEVEIYICLSDMIRFKGQLEAVHRNLEGVAEFRTTEISLLSRLRSTSLATSWPLVSF